jgi:hypothetical protein
MTISATVAGDLLELLAAEPAVLTGARIGTPGCRRTASCSTGSCTP